jgi:hypothetical protein
VNGGGRMVIKGYSSKRDSHGFLIEIPDFTNAWVTTSGATLLNGFLRKTEDTIELSAYFAPPVMALYIKTSSLMK